MKGFFSRILMFDDGGNWQDNWWHALSIVFVLVLTIYSTAKGEPSAWVFWYVSILWFIVCVIPEIGKLFRNRRLNENHDATNSISNALSTNTNEGSPTEIRAHDLEAEDLQEAFNQADAFVTVNPPHAIVEGAHRERIENREQKKRIAILEGFSCQICNASFEYADSHGNKSYRIDVDHIIEKSKGGGEEMRNLWVLCPNCHLKKTIGRIIIDVEQKKVFQEGQEIQLHHDRHLFI